MTTVRLPLVFQHMRALVRRHAAEAADGPLLERFVRQRDEAAFEVLVWRHGPMVLSLCRRLLHNPHDAEDVLQATFLTLVRKASSIGKRESLGSWLYKVAYRTALRARARAARRAAPGGRVEEVPAAPGADDAAWRELRPLLDEALGRLPEKYRTPIVLHYLQGKTHREVAEQLGCPMGTVSTRLIRGRELLRRQLARHGLALTGGALAALLAQNAVSAAVPTPLAADTVRAATLLLAGQAGAVSAPVAGLIEGAHRAMSLTRFKLTALVLVAVGALVAGAGTLLRREAAARPPDTPPAEVAKPPRPAADAPVVVRGRVLDPDGKPIAGARLYWPRLRTQQSRGDEDVDFPQRGVSDAEGRFRLELPRSDIHPETNLSLVAAAAGYGVDWAELPRGERPADLTLRLVKDEPIKGQVLNTEGKPLAGVRVSVSALLTTTEGRLDPFLTGWKQEWRLAHERATKRLYVPLDKLLPVKPTGADGRFEIAGVGVERVAFLHVKGPGIARGTLYVVARAGFDPKPYNEAALGRIPAELRIPGQPPLLYGPSPTFVAAAERLIRGTVREAVSGKPVPGITVWGSAGYGESVSAVSDSEGRYRLSGIPKMKQYLLHAEPNDKGSWLRGGARARDNGGLDPVTADITLARGVVLTGRVIDRTTGKGVKAGVRFVPLPDNKFFGKPGYDSYNYERLMTPTDAEGRYRITVIPGGGVLMAQAYASDRELGGLPVKPYRQASFDPIDAKRVPVTDPKGDRYFNSAGGLEFLSNENAVKVLDLAAEAGAVTRDLFVDRGETRTVKVQDADGRPLKGAFVAGMTASWPITFPLDGASCTVYALDPKEPRLLVFYHPEKKLAGTLTVRGDEKEEPAVRLAPAGSVSGRLLDADGQPQDDVEVAPVGLDKTVRELYRQLDQRRGPVRTDRNGRFRLEGVVPGVKFQLSLRQGRTFLVGEPRIGTKEIKPGQSLDLGDVRTKPQ
jgi:RNA polymerase sigma factor (sigma-70 family)